jgi:hypothetical protein
MAFNQPSVYAKWTYLNMVVGLEDDSLSMVSIDRYLNAGITGDSSHPRAVRAGQEKDGLLGAIAGELKVAHTPHVFQIGGWTVNRHDIQMTFAGKGSPTQIRDTLWLASYFKRVSSKTIKTYCERYIGLDCNGFAGNFWGIDSNTPIDSYDTGRRKELAAVSVGDALVFYNKGGTSPFHLAVVDEVQIRGAKLSLTIVQSAGLEQGLHVDSIGDQTIQKDAKGNLFFTRKGDTQLAFFAAGPAKQKPNV